MSISACHFAKMSAPSVEEEMADLETILGIMVEQRLGVDAEETRGASSSLPDFDVTCASSVHEIRRPAQWWKGQLLQSSPLLAEQS